MVDELPGTAELERLPENHRRVVAALLATLTRHITELASAGAIRASREAVAQFTELSRSLGTGPLQGHLEPLRQALLVQLDEIEPSRLAGYGPLTPEQEATLNRLAAALRALLESPTGCRSC